MKYYVVGWAPDTDRMDCWRPLGQNTNDVSRWKLERTTFYTSFDEAQGEAFHRQFRQKGVAYFCVLEVEV